MARPTTRAQTTYCPRSHWPRWQQAGMSSASAGRSGGAGGWGRARVTGRSSWGGAELLGGELFGRPGAPCVVHIGTIEAGAIQHRAKGLMPEQREVTHGVYIDRVEREGDTVTAFRMIDHRDMNLEHHSVAGVGTLPGCFVVELAAEAVRVLHPGLFITGLRDLEFHAFVR